MIILNMMEKPPYEVTFKHKPVVRPTEKPPEPHVAEEPLPPHPDLKRMVLRLGELEGYIVKEGVPLNKEFLDASW